MDGSDEQDRERPTTAHGVLAAQKSVGETMRYL